MVRNNPAVALLLDFAKLDREHPVNYNTFFGTPLPNEQLVRRPLSDEERWFFAAAAQYGGGFTIVGTGDDCHAPATTAVA